MNHIVKHTCRIKFLFFAFMLLALQPLKAQTPFLPKETEELEVMKWITSHRHPTDVIHPERFILPKDFWQWLNDEFTLEEVAFLQQQHEAAPKTWDAKKVRNVVSDFKMNANTIYYQYSTPLFTPDGKYAVIVKQYSTGNLGSEVCMLLLRKTDTGWEIDKKRFKRIYCGIS